MEEKLAVLHEENQQIMKNQIAIMGAMTYFKGTTCFAKNIRDTQKLINEETRE